MDKNNNTPVTRFQLILALIGCVAMQPATAQIEFEDVSSATNMTGYTESWGGSWGDVNNDNWPDILNQGHRDFPRLYRNTGEGTFEDIAYETDPGNWIGYIFDDKHGATFVDFDNDGDDDLLVSVSATGPAQFLINDGTGSFVDRAVDADLSNDSAARMQAWFDYTGDGLLDVTQVNTGGASLRYRDPRDRFNPQWDFDNERDADFNCNDRLNYAQLIDIDGDGSLDLICANEGSFPERVYDVSSLPFDNISSLMPTTSNVNDSAVGDLDGDLLSDMVLTRGAIRPSGAAMAGASRIEAWLRKDNAIDPGKGFFFETAGDLTVLVDHKDMGLYDDSEVLNLSAAGTSSGDAGPVRVEYDAGEGRWRAFLTDSGTTQAYLQIDSTDVISNLIEDQLDSPEFATETVHLQNGPGGLSPVYTSGLYVPVYCVSAVIADLDNDMDQDVYLVCRRGAENLPNRVYENQGDGTFVEVLSHGGEGPVGVGFQYGVGESVVAADYDVDGFIDLYVMNGLLYYPVGEGGPDTLLRNKGNGNHWVEIDLEGTTSNRDAVGAKVYVTAGGVTQLREQNGGYHRWSQNDQRLHIGLGPNLTADITVEWPLGATDTWTGVAADQLYTATEGGTIAPATLGSPVYTEILAGDECGQPPYDPDYGPAILLWKDCGTGVWSFRAQGGRAETLQISEGQIIADAPFSGVTGVGLTGTDLVSNSTPERVDFSIAAWFVNDKGFDLSTAGQTTACLSFGVQDYAAVIVGGSKKRISGGLDLVTLEACAAPPPPLDLPECGEPAIDNNTENAFFAWRDCDFVSASAVRWNFTMSAGGAAWGPNSGLITSDVILSAVGEDLEANDIVDSVPGDMEIDFTLNVGGSGIDKFRVDVPLGSQSCLETDTLPAGVLVLVGEDKLPGTASFDLLTAESCDTGCHP